MKQFDCREGIVPETHAFSFDLNPFVFVVIKVI